MKKIMTVNGMHCEHCKNRVESLLKEFDGIKTAKVDLEKKTVTISLKSEISDETLENAVKEAGFEPVKTEIKKGLFF